MRQIQRPLAKKRHSVTIHAKRANMFKDWRLNLNPDRISYMFTTKAQRRNSRRTTWQYKPGWCDFVLQAVKLTEVISRTIVLMILRSVCIFSLNSMQQLCATYLTPKFKPLAISPQRQTAPKSKPQQFLEYIGIKSLTDI